MKTNLLAVIFLAIITLSSCGNYVTKIVHDYNADTTRYYHNSKDITNYKNRVAKDGTNVKVEVQDYNPLTINVTVNQEAPKLNFQTSNFSPLMQFLTPGNTTVSAPTDSEHNEKLVGKTNTPLEDLQEAINERVKIITDTISSYKLFYNSIASLNNSIEQAKYNNRLTEQCLCTDLKGLIEEIHKYFFDKDHKTVTICPSTMVCGDLINGEEVSYQKTSYYNDFIYNLNVLDSLATKIKSEQKKLSGKQLQDFVKQVTPVQDQLDQLKKTLTAVKDDYLATRSNSIDQAINKYKVISFLEFSTNAGVFKVEETDEFKIDFSFENTLVNKTTVRKIGLDVVKPMKIDYSAGVFFSPGLYDQDFDIVQKDSGKFYIKKTDAGKHTYGAIGYVNFHPIFNPWFSAGFSIGTGLMFNNSTKVVFSPAVSFIFGRYQRAIIHVGGAFAQVDRVHSLYADDFVFTDATYKPEFKKEISSSFLFGVTWNLSK